MKVRIAQASIHARRSPKRFAESACKRLQRTVVGVEGNVCDRRLAMPQLVRGSLQQQTSPHSSRGLLNHSPKQPMKLRAALIGPPRQVLRLRLSVQRVRDDSREPVCRFLAIWFMYARGFHVWNES